MFRICCVSELAQLVETSALEACVHVRAEDQGSTTGANKIDTGYYPLRVDEM